MKLTCDKGAMEVYEIEKIYDCIYIFGYCCKP